MPPLGRSERSIELRHDELGDDAGEIIAFEEKLAAMMISVTTRQVHDRGWFNVQSTRLVRRESKRAQYQIPGEIEGATIEAWVEPIDRTRFIEKNGGAALFTRTGHIVNDAFIPVGPKVTRATFDTDGGGIGRSLCLHYGHDGVVLESLADRCAHLQEIEDTLIEVMKAQDFPAINKVDPSTGHAI